MMDDKFFDHCPEWKAKALTLNAEIVRLHNQCHDATLSGNIFIEAVEALKLAEDRLTRHCKAESDRYFAAVAKEQTDGSN